MIVAVIGSRLFSDEKLLEEILSEEQIDHLITGDARGADTLAIGYARRHDIPFTSFVADWSDTSKPDSIIKYHADGKPYDAYAGIRRNTDIIAAADKVIAFWDGIEKNSGTFDGITKAKQLGKSIKIVKYLLL